MGFPADLERVDPAERAQHKAELRREAKDVAGLPLPERMALAYRYLNTLAVGVWAGDESWRADLRDVTTSLVPGEDETRDDGELSSLIAVCLAQLLQDARLRGGSEADAVARAAWEQAQEWAAFAEDKHVERFLQASTEAGARVVTAGEVQEVVELAMAAADDQHAELLAALEAEGITAELMNGVWVIDGDFRNPLRVAARASTLIGESCVLARNTKQSVVLLWHDGTLAMADSKIPRWRVYQIKAPVTPQSKFSGGEGLPPTRDSHPLAPAPEHVRRLADAVGVNLSHLLAALR
ncbi:hypothetical protein [Lentzea tibetensis]|uniref:hypothetical protein n=1 Tax=Lentzea tibetensis TaxID=2591470 RepID=UPI001648F9EF|nr:hypothetical protein [Lentzea tibetensis]